MDAFENVVDYDGVKEELNKVVDIFNNADVYKKIGAKTPRGILLYGMPGLGKTLFANDFIKACNVDSFNIINNKRRSDLVKEINDVFIKASNCKKAIIFIDDIDKFGTTDFDDEPDIIFSTIQTNIESIKGKDILVIAKNDCLHNEVAIDLTGYNKENLYEIFTKSINYLNEHCEENFNCISGYFTSLNKDIRSLYGIEKFTNSNYINKFINEKRKKSGKKII